MVDKAHLHALAEMHCLFCLIGIPQVWGIVDKALVPLVRIGDRVAPALRLIVCESLGLLITAHNGGCEVLGAGGRAGQGRLQQAAKGACGHASQVAQRSNSPTGCLCAGALDPRGRHAGLARVLWVRCAPCWLHIPRCDPPISPCPLICRRRQAAAACAATPAGAGAHHSGVPGKATRDGCSVHLSVLCALACLSSPTDCVKMHLPWIGFLGLCWPRTLACPALVDNSPLCSRAYRRTNSCTR